MQHDYLNQPVGTPGQAALVVDMVPNKQLADKQDIDTVINYRVRADSRVSKTSTGGSANVTSMNQQKRR